MKRWGKYGLAALALVHGGAMAGLADPATGAVPSVMVPDVLSLLVEISINGKVSDDLVGLDLVSSECTRIETAPLVEAGVYSGGAKTACLESISGLEYRLDQKAARIDVYAAAPPPPRRIGFQPENLARPVSGIVGGYGLSAQRVDVAGEDVINAFGDLSLTLHTPQGRIQNDMIAVAGDGAGRIRRLLTVYERDFPASLTRLSIGDSFTAAPRWGRITPFVGIQYGTDFSMDPRDSWRPYSTFQALLRERSEVDVRVNGAVRQKHSVEPGFSHFEIRPETGLNEVEVIIREAGGLTRIEDYSFFSSADALAKGVTDYSASLGLPRRFNGISSEYEDALAANGFVRHGVADALTAEAYSEVGKNGGLIGGGGQLTAGKIGVVSFSSGVSRARDGPAGHIVSAGFERSSRKGSLQVQARFADPHYTDTASGLGLEFPDRSIRASGGIFTPAGSFRASYIEEADKVLSDRRFLSLGWEKPLRGDRVSFSASAYQDFARDETGFAISLRMSFGAYNAGGRYQTAGSREASSVQISRSRMPGERVQWALGAADSGAGTVYQGDMTADLGSADLFLNGGVYGETRQMMAGLRGGFAAMPGAVALQRHTTGATAIVRMPDLKGLPIYKDSRIIAVTGENGLAIIPEVRPYEVNTLSLRPEDVPLEYEVRDFRAQFVPGRGISEVQFDVRRETALAFTAVFPTGEHLPPGSRVELLQSALICPVGLEGRVYCPVAEEGDTIAVTTLSGRFVEPVSAVRARGEMRLRPEGRVEMARID